MHLLISTMIPQPPTARSALLALAFTLLVPLCLNTNPMVAHAQTSYSCTLDNVSCVLMSATVTSPPRCFGTTLPFTHTALLWTNDSSTLVDIKTHLALWEGLRNIPQCWAVVQPFLCSMYLPK